MAISNFAGVTLAVMQNYAGMRSAVSDPQAQAALDTITAKTGGELASQVFEWAYANAPSLNPALSATAADIGDFATGYGFFALGTDMRGALMALVLRGTPLPAGSVAPDPVAAYGPATPVPPSLTQVQAKQSAALSAAYYAAVHAPVSFTNAAGTAASFPQSDEAKTYLAQTIVAGASAWAATGLNSWIAVGGAVIAPFSFADLQGLAAAMEAAEVPPFVELHTRLAAVAHATTVEAVQAITF